MHRGEQTQPRPQSLYPDLLSSLTLLGHPYESQGQGLVTGL